MQDRNSEADANALATPHDGDQAVSVDVASSLRQSRPTRRTVSASEEKKSAATPKRRSKAADTEKHTTPAQFVNQSIDELKKVVWPTGTQVRSYFAVVLVFVLFVIAYVSLLDLGLGAALLKLFG